MTKRQKILILIALPVAVLSTIIVLALVSAFSVTWVAATRAGNEAATIQNLKTIAAVETQYFNIHTRTYATFDQLVREEMLGRKFAGHPVIADGFVLTLKLDQQHGYTLTADPQDRSSGKRHFYLDSASTRIRANQDGPAGPHDPVL